MTPEEEQLLLQRLRDATPTQKMEMVESANRTARMLAMADLRERFPQESEARLRRRLADLLLGPELAAKAYGPFPDDESELPSCDRKGGGGIVDG